MDLNQFAKEVHENAVAHGWWEGERELEEILALIHSEWSEALEEYRAGRPMVWHKCPYNNGVCENQVVHQGEFDCRVCTPDKRKPEGVAVELIDGCIRIIDFLEQQGVGIGGLNPDNYDEVGMSGAFLPLICFLHGFVTKMLESGDLDYLGGALGVALWWVQLQGVDALALMREKHEYNKARPYKHGGKVC